MESTTYTKRPFWQRLLCYLVIGGLLYAGLYAIVRSTWNKEMPLKNTELNPMSRAPVAPDLIGDSRQFVLAMQNNSGQSGRAKIESWKDSVIVSISLTGYTPNNIPQPAHLYSGDCLHKGSLQYTLSPVVNGESVTRLRVSLDSVLKKAPLVIDVVKSSTESGNQTSCGRIQ